MLERTAREKVSRIRYADRERRAEYAKSLGVAYKACDNRVLACQVPPELGFITAVTLGRSLGAAYKARQITRCRIKAQPSTWCCIQSRA
jgi:hypothetical protein